MALKKKAKKKAPIKGGALEKLVDAAVENMQQALASGSTAIDARSKEVKTLNTQSSRLRKKRATLLKRKKVTSSKLKKAPNAELRKLLRDVERELVSVRKDLEKTTSAKEAAAGELSVLKSSFKKAALYSKGIEKADKALNKPAKKKKRKKSVKTV
ncbi:MAG TPA: hypothetical protein VF268_05830 [Gammaproteobacteria bacterium]